MNTEYCSLLIADYCGGEGRRGRGCQTNPSSQYAVASLFVPSLSSIKPARSSVESLSRSNNEQIQNSRCAFKLVICHETKSTILPVPPVSLDELSVISTWGLAGDPILPPRKCRQTANKTVEHPVFSVHWSILNVLTGLVTQ